MSNYLISIRDGGVPASSLTPTLLDWINLSDGVAATPQPTITSIGNGKYRLSVATPPEARCGTIDAGATLEDADRYIDVLVTPNDELIANSDVAASTLLASNDYTAPDNASITAIKAKTDNLPASPANETTVASRLASAAYVAPDNSGILSAISAIPTNDEFAIALSLVATTTDIEMASSEILDAIDGISASGNGLTIDQLNSALIPIAKESTASSRLATSAYIAPDNTSIAAIKAKTDNLPNTPANESTVASRLASSSYVAPDNASITAIKAKTDNLPASPASELTVESRLAASAYTAPNNAGILSAIDAIPTNSELAIALNPIAKEATVSAVKAKTDNIPADPARESTVTLKLNATDYVAPDNAGIIAAIEDPVNNSQIVNAIIASGEFLGWGDSITNANIQSIIDGVWAKPIDGTLTAGTALKNTTAYSCGRVRVVGSGVYAYYDNSGSSVAYTLTGSPTGRTKS